MRRRRWEPAAIVFFALVAAGCPRERPASNVVPDAQADAATPAPTTPAPATPEDAGARPAFSRRPTRGETRLAAEPGHLLAADDDVIDLSPACARGVEVEIRLEEMPRDDGSVAFRASLKNCASRPRTILHHPDVAPLRLALEAQGRAVAISDDRADRKFDNTLFCPRPFAPGEERAVERLAFAAGQVRSAAFFATPALPVTAMLVLEAPARTCVDGDAPKRPAQRPKDAFVGQVSSRSVTFGSPEACTCPALGWKDGPALAAWTEHRVESDCRWTTVHHGLGARGDASCTRRIRCSGPRGGRGLAALVAEPEVASAFARDADFGGRAASARDARAIRLALGGHTLFVAGDRTVAMPPAVRRLADFFASDIALEDGGLLDTPVDATADVCP